MKVGQGKPGPGRPKGSPNKITRDIREAVVEAFEKAGGVEYLARQAKENPQAFMTLLGKVLPLQVVGDPDRPIAIISDKPMSNDEWVAKYSVVAATGAAKSVN